MPTHIFETMVLAFHGLGKPVHHDDRMLAYLFEYESGLALVAAMSFGQRKTWFGTRPVLRLAIFGASGDAPLVEDSVAPPSRPTALDYCARVGAKLIAMAQVEADAPGGGRSLNYALTPLTQP